MGISAILFAGLLSLQGATPVQHQHAAMALYQVFISAVVEGQFTGARTDASVSATKLDFDLSLGSGVAVSSDGYVLTAHHVAGYTDIVEDVCRVMAGEWQSVVIHRMELHVTLSDLAGNDWPALWDVTPPTENSDVCSGSYGMRVRFGAVRYIASAEPIADLVLLKIDVPVGSSISYVPLGSTSELVPLGSSVFVFGFTDVGRHVRQDGYFVRPCELYPTRLTTGQNGTAVREERRLTRFVSRLEEGMSGGPVMSGDSLIGITTSKSLLGDVGLGIPVDYIKQWYAYVRGGREGSFPDVVCTLPKNVTPEP